MERLTEQDFRRCACDAEQELRWETPQRRMYACSNCGIWWEVPAIAVMEEVTEDEETFQDTL